MKSHKSKSSDVKELPNENGRFHILGALRYKFGVPLKLNILKSEKELKEKEKRKKRALQSKNQRYSELPDGITLGARVRVFRSNDKIVEGEITTTDVVINIEVSQNVILPFYNQFMTNIIMKKGDPPMLVYGENNIPLGIIWASSDIISIVQPLTKLG